MPMDGDSVDFVPAALEAADLEEARLAEEASAAFAAAASGVLAAPIAIWDIRVYAAPTISPAWAAASAEAHTIVLSLTTEAAP